MCRRKHQLRTAVASLAVDGVMVDAVGVVQHIIWIPNLDHHIPVRSGELFSCFQGNCYRYIIPGDVSRFEGVTSPLTTLLPL